MSLNAHVPRASDVFPPTQMDMGESVAEAGERMMKSIQGKVSAALDGLMCMP